jgi:GDPmannose 4,6-dehydratase
MSVDSKKRALITGVTGQDGSYLAEFLLDKGYEVHGMKRRASSFNTQRVDHLFRDHHSAESNFFLHYGDMTDSTNIIRLIAEVQPDEIYNLAAQSHVQVSFESPEYTSNTAGIGVLRVLEAIRLLGLESRTKFYQASTSEMFGLSENNLPLNEESRFYPRSPYAASKVYAHQITVNYREAYGIFASSGILFNHESPRRGETFVTRKIVQAAVRISKGRQECLYLGNLNSIRDWGHASDYVDGMWRILQHHIPDDFVLATGVAVAVRDFVEMVFDSLSIPISWSGSGIDELGIDDTGNVRIRVDSKYFRPTEVPFLLGDASKAKRELGWSPKYTLPMLVKEMVDEELKSLE